MKLIDNLKRADYRYNKYMFEDIRLWQLPFFHFLESAYAHMQTFFELFNAVYLIKVVLSKHTAALK